MDKSRSKVIDWQLGEDLVGGDLAIAQEMLGHLLAELPAYSAELTDAWQQRDNKQLQIIAHKLYGGACYCGTPRLKQAAKALEKNIIDQVSVESIKQVYDDLQHEIGALMLAAREDINLGCSATC